MPPTPTRCAQRIAEVEETQQPPFEESAQPGGDSMQSEKQPTQQEQQPTEKSNQRTSLTRFGQRAYVLGAREREIFIDSTINTNNYRGIS